MTTHRSRLPEPQVQRTASPACLFPAIFRSVPEQSRLGNFFRIHDSCRQENIPRIRRIGNSYFNLRVTFISSFAAKAYAHRRDILADSQLVVGAALPHARSQPRLEPNALSLPLLLPVGRFTLRIRIAPALGAPYLLRVFMRCLHPNAWHAASFAVPRNPAV